MVLVLAAAGCGGKQTKNGTTKPAAAAPAPTVAGSTTTGGAALPALQQATAKYVTSCVAAAGAKSKSFCRCVVQRLRSTLSRHDFLVVLQSGRTPPASVQAKVRRATSACRAKLR